VQENHPNYTEHTKLFDRQHEINSDFERRLSRVESRQDVSDEKFSQVFKKLDEIIEILKISQSRLPNMVWGLAGSVGGGVAVWLVLQFIQK
jgi:hypothetical protein